MGAYDDGKPPLRFYTVARTNRVSKNESEETGFYAHEEGVGFIPRKMWPEAIKQACFDTWLDEIDNPLREEQIYTFTKHWGGFEPEALIQMLQQGNETERIFAIFTLEHLAPPDVVMLLAPLLHSRQRKERWASAISLGRGRHEIAFALLQNLLREDVVYNYPHDPTLFYAINDAVEKAEQLFGQDGAWKWEELIDPALLEAWNKQQENDEEFRWYTIHRLTITRLLGTWGKSEAIPTLRQALHICQERLDHYHFPSEISHETVQNLTFLQRLLSETLAKLSEE